MSTHEISQLKETLDEHWELMSKIDKNQDNMMKLLQGNPIDQMDRGLLGRVATTETKVKTLEMQRDRAFWMIVGISGIIGAAWGFIKLFIK
jgi:hypothetical protein